MGRQASKRHRHRQKACARKERYSRVVAVQIAAQRGLDWYRCTVCGDYHLMKRQIEHFEMSSTVASVEGECARCLSAESTPEQTCSACGMALTYRHSDGCPLAPDATPQSQSGAA